MNDTNEITSIWDGWERQCYGTLFDDGCPRSFCARGFLTMKERTLPQEEVRRIEKTLLAETYQRVADYIRSNYQPPAYYASNRPALLSENRHNHLVIAYANNELRLTPEQFREIDRLTQIEAASKPLIESVEIAVGVGR